MTSQKTIYHLIVDKSGSMTNCIDKTITGFNEQVTRIEQLQREFPEQDITIGLTTFNHQVDHHFFQAQPRQVQMLSGRTYRPNGNTAFLDAIGNTLQIIEDGNVTDGRQITPTFIVVILTDGCENASKNYVLQQIRARISRLEGTGNWTFSFIGATLDAVDMAEKMSIKRENSFAFTKSGMQEEVWDKLSDSVHCYLDKKRSGKQMGNFFEK